MFSGRVPRSLEPGPWARRLAALRAANAPLIDLTDHNPTTADLEYLDAIPWPMLASPHARVYRPDPRGHEQARGSVARYYPERGLSADPERVLLTASTSEGYAHAFRLSCDAGDEVLVPRPSYPLFAPIAAAEAVRLVPYDLSEAGAGWRLSATALAEALARATRPKALVVVQPNHPTGSCLTHAEAERVVEACAERSLVLVADEVFGDFVFGGPRPAHDLRASFAGETRCVTLTLSGLSKVCGLPQLKLGWIVVSGPPSLAEDAYARLEWIADAFLSVPATTERSLPGLLAGRARFQENVRARVAANRASLARVDGVRVLPADGGWSALVALPGEHTDEEWALALLEHDVVVHPGYFYDFAEPGRLVLSLLPPELRVRSALDALAAVARG